jgi:hypothetical protein
MQVQHHLTDDQAVWLKKILASRENSRLFDQLVIPEDVENALVAKGLVRRFRNGDVEITLGGIREVTRWPMTQDRSTVGEEQLEASSA